MCICLHSGIMILAAFVNGDVCKHVSQIRTRDIYEDFETKVAFTEVYLVIRTSFNPLEL